MMFFHVAGNVRDWRASDEAVYAILLSFGALLALIQVL